MRLLFEMDRKDYDPNGSRFERPSVRGIIRKDGKVAMVHSKKYDYYKFPGGGIEPGEEQCATLAREVREESGLVVLPETIQEFGWVHRIQKGSVDGKPLFVVMLEREARVMELLVEEGLVMRS